MRSEWNWFYVAMMVGASLLALFVLHDLFIPLFLMSGAVVLVKDNICKLIDNYRNNTIYIQRSHYDIDSYTTDTQDACFRGDFDCR